MLNKIVLIIIFLGISSAASANNSVVTINNVPSSYSGYYINPEIQTAETHVIGVYETRGDHSFNYHPEGTAFVHVSGSASTPVNLVLSSYEPTKWVLDGEGLSFLSSVLVNGYHASRVVGVDSSLIINKTGLGNYISACSYGWPSTTGGCDTKALVNGVESLYETKITTFTSAYRASDFSLLLSPVPEATQLSMLSLGIFAITLYRRRHLT